jgi:ubiquinone/menaquinone biosynthesis C-methylase UbiE
MVHTFDPARMGSLTSERRQQAVKPLEMLQRAGVQAGDLVLDWGCGAGFFALPTARLVGEAGRVVAVDIQPEMVEATKEAVSLTGLANIEVRAAGEYELPGGVPAFDWVILAYILHEVHEPQRLLGAARGTLKPGGRLLIVEWPKEVGPHGPPAAERLAPADLVTLYQPLGLQQIEFWEAPPEYYALVLQAGSSGW